MQVITTDKFQINEQSIWKIKSVLQNPLTFVILVWGLMIFFAGLYFVYA